MDVEPWEALDLDDSDLPLLLRPCKQLRSSSSDAAEAVPGASSAAADAPCQAPEENRHDQQQQHQPQPSTSRHRAIPGPAGAVLAAMLRKKLDSANYGFCDNRDEKGEEINGHCLDKGVISTQDYIRRVVENTAEFDEDFTRHPWLSALQIIGAENGVVRSTPISSVKKCLNVGRVAQVVAVIKSCTPNGHGGLLVSLKDPTGTIGASIHHKVLSESEFGRNLTTGAALILQEVAIFAPVRSAHYLNVTLRNLVKVFCPDGGLTSRLTNTAYPLQYADPGIEYSGNGKRSLEMPNMQNVKTRDIEQGQCTRKPENLQNTSVIQQQNLFGISFQPNKGSGSDASGGMRGHLNLRNDSCTTMPEDMIRARNAVNQQEFVKGGDLGGNRLGNMSIHKPISTHTGEDIRVNEAQMQRQPVVLKASLPQWTDEQLDELFSGNEDDCSSLF